MNINCTTMKSTKVKSWSRKQINVLMPFSIVEINIVYRKNLISAEYNLVSKLKKNNTYMHFE